MTYCRTLLSIIGKEYRILDTSPEWDIRHFLADREDYKEAIENTETLRIITPYKSNGSAVLYKIEKNP